MPKCRNKYRQLISSSQTVIEDGTNTGEASSSIRANKTSLRRRKSITSSSTDGLAIDDPRLATPSRHYHSQQPLFSTPSMTMSSKTRSELSSLSRSKSLFSSPLLNSQQSVSLSTISLPAEPTFTRTNSSTEKRQYQQNGAAVFNPKETVNYFRNVKAFLRLERACHRFKDSPPAHILEIAKQP